MALKDIIQKIEDDFAKYMKDSEEKLAEEKKNIDSHFSKLYEVKTESLEESTQEKKNQIIKKLGLASRTLERNTRLNVKQKLIDKVFEEVQKSVEGMKDDEYKAVLVKIFTAADCSGKCEIHAAKGKQKITEEAMAEAKVSGTVKKGNFAAGVIIEGESMLIDAVFENIVHNKLRPSLETQVAQILF